VPEQGFPSGWDCQRVQEVIAHYDAQTEDEEAQEIEDAVEKEGVTWIAIPSALVDKVRALIAREQGA
jgi:hypothetical protein